jgi:protease-4
MTANQVEVILDRRQLKRRLLRWRIIAVLAILLALAALVWQAGDLKKQQDHIARIRIEGLITGDQLTLELLESLAKTDRVKAVLVHIDSPGGTTVGSEAIYEKIRAIAAKKPVASVMDSVAASGGYITALATDHIVARGNTVTGSIGVVFSFPEFSEMLGKLGIRMEEIKSGELKAEPTPYKPMSERVRQVTNEMVQESFQWFLGLVAERRKLPMDQVRILADGRVYSGRQAVANKLIDELGSEEQAVIWLKAQGKLADGIQVLEWQRKAEGLAGSYGISTLLRMAGWEKLGKRAEAASLDGLLVLWHPQL